jgi:hypothetical protein
MNNLRKHPCSDTVKKKQGRMILMQFTGEINCNNYPKLPSKGQNSDHETNSPFCSFDSGFIFDLLPGNGPG